MKGNTQQSPLVVRVRQEPVKKAQMLHLVNGKKRKELVIPRYTTSSYLRSFVCPEENNNKNDNKTKLTTSYLRFLLQLTNYKQTILFASAQHKFYSTNFLTWLSQLCADKLYCVSLRRSHRRVSYISTCTHKYIIEFQSRNCKLLGENLKCRYFSIALAQISFHFISFYQYSFAPNLPLSIAVINTQILTFLCFSAQEWTTPFKYISLKQNKTDLLYSTL